jgi:UDP-3-O-[3-hydroxymyristoyl] glucosamine N-acyltransferase
MADPRFFDNKGPFDLGALAEVSGASLQSPDDAKKLVVDVAPLDQATGEHLSFLDNAAYLKAFSASSAGACVCAPQHAAKAPEGMSLLLSDEPYRAYALMAQKFYPAPTSSGDIAPSAVVDATASIGDRVEIGAGAVIGARAEIAAGCRIGANVSVGSGVVLGEGCNVGANSSLSHCLVGRNVTIYPGVCIGQDGFGFAASAAGHVKVPQVGRVVIGDNCEIGSNSTIDRGANRDTVIGEGCWIDNLVQIGHNVEIGRGCIIVAMAGISGSSKIGDFVAIGGQVGIAGHLTIGAGARLAAKCGVMTDVPAGETVSGAPAMPIKEHFRQVAVLKRLAQKRGQDK